jgi:threonine/homoserine/homoserine lactone efflux protein
MMILGGILVFTALVADLFIAISGGALSRSMLAQPLVQKIQNWLAGTVLIALGLRLAISEQK